MTSIYRTADKVTLELSLHELHLANALIAEKPGDKRGPTPKRASVKAFSGRYVCLFVCFSCWKIWLLEGLFDEEGFSFVECPSAALVDAAAVDLHHAVGPFTRFP
mgnify:CR=1 FL=1